MAKKDQKETPIKGGVYLYTLKTIDKVIEYDFYHFKESKGGSGGDVKFFIFKNKKGDTLISYPDTFPHNFFKIGEVDLEAKFSYLFTQ